jgi:hypothetical protein
MQRSCSEGDDGGGSPAAKRAKHGPAHPAAAAPGSSPAENLLAPDPARPEHGNYPEMRPGVEAAPSGGPASAAAPAAPRQQLLGAHCQHLLPGSFLGADSSGAQEEQVAAASRRGGPTCPRPAPATPPPARPTKAQVAARAHASSPQQQQQQQQQQQRAQRPQGPGQPPRQQAPAAASPDEAQRQRHRQPEGGSPAGPAAAPAEAAAAAAGVGQGLLEAMLGNVKPEPMQEPPLQQLWQPPPGSPVLGGGGGHGGSPPPGHGGRALALRGHALDAGLCRQMIDGGAGGEPHAAAAGGGGAAADGTTLPAHQQLPAAAQQPPAAAQLQQKPLPLPLPPLLPVDLFSQQPPAGYSLGPQQPQPPGSAAAAPLLAPATAPQLASAYSYMSRHIGSRMHGSNKRWAIPKTLPAGLLPPGFVLPYHVRRLAPPAGPGFASHTRPAEAPACLPACLPA